MTTTSAQHPAAVPSVNQPDRLTMSTQESIFDSDDESLPAWARKKLDHNAASGAGAATNAIRGSWATFSQR